MFLDYLRQIPPSKWFNPFPSKLFMYCPPIFPSLNSPNFHPIFSIFLLFFSLLSSNNKANTPQILLLMFPAFSFQPLPNRHHNLPPHQQVYSPNWFLIFSSPKILSECEQNKPIPKFSFSPFAKSYFLLIFGYNSPLFWIPLTNFFVHFQFFLPNQPPFCPIQMPLCWPQWVRHWSPLPRHKMPLPPTKHKYKQINF